MSAELEEIVRNVSRLLPDRSAARRSAEGEGPIDWAVWSALAGLGLTAISLPHELGGSELGLAEEAAVAEALAKVVAPVPIVTAYLAAHVLAASTVREGRDLAKQLASGETVVGVGLSVARDVRLDLAVDTGPDGAALVTGEVADLVDGSALDVVLLPIAGSWWALRLDGVGVMRQGHATLDPTRELASVSFRGAPACAVSEFPCERVLPLAWTLLTSEAAGAMAGGLELSQAYALQRRQFGELIGRFQAIKIKLANGLIALEAARSAVAAAVASEKDGAPIERMARMAKAAGCGLAPETLGEFVQLHGAIGNTWDHDLHLLMRRAKFCQQALGSSDRHLDALADDLLTNPPRSRRGEHRIEDEFELEQIDKAFLEELRAYLDEHASPDRIKEVRSGDSAVQKAFQSELADGRWVAVDWPAEHNGRDASFMQLVLYHTEMASRGVPRLIGGNALSIIGNGIIRHGSADLQSRYLEGIRRGELLFCQGFSEPGAGSDLASLQSRAVLDGDELVISGSKIWTTGAQEADFMFGLFRTGPLHPKHKGISAVVVPMDSDGLTIRPIRRIHGIPHFSQVFFDEVRVPVANVVGAIDGGWEVARTSLSHEHLTHFLAAQMRQTYLLEYMIHQLAQREAVEGVVDRNIRRRMAQSWANAQILRMNALRNIFRVQQGEDPGAEGSIMKVFGQEEERRIYELGLDMRGVSGLVDHRAGRDYLGARAATVGGGTSEIHRNKIAERVLGMPRDPWADEELAGA